MCVVKLVEFRDYSANRGWACDFESQVSVVEALEPTFGVNRCLATRAGRSNGLPVVVIDDITTGKDTRDRCAGRIWLSDEITVWFNLELIDE